MRKTLLAAVAGAAVAAAAAGGIASATIPAPNGVITAGLVFAPWGGLQWAIYLLAATAWLTVLQRVFSVRRQLHDSAE